VAFVPKVSLFVHEWLAQAWLRARRLIGFGAMPRIPRSVFPDGLFHVAARGVAQTPIYHDAHDRRNFLSLLAVVVQHYEWTCQAFCLMTNHYHLVLDATRENLSGGMQILNGDYAQGFNGKYGR
jgi:putative transposase